MKMRTLLLGLVLALGASFSYASGVGGVGGVNTVGQWSTNASQQATADYNFITSPFLPSGMTFSRTSSATVYNSSGTRITVGRDVARFDYNPTNLTPQGFLVEGSVTNYLVNSDTPALQTTGSLSAGTYTLWMEGTGSVTVAAVTAIGSGFGTATSGSPVTFTVSTAGTVLVTPIGSPTLFQLENIGFPTSYIPTLAATETRNIDIASINNLSLLKFNASEGTIVFEGDLVGFSQDYQTALGLSSGSLSNGIYLRVNGASGFLEWTCFNSGVPQFAQAFSRPSNGTRFKTAVSFSGNRAQFSFNGTLGTEDTTVSMPTVDRLTVGNAFGQRAWNGHIKRIVYYPFSVSDNQLATFTQLF